MLDSTCILTHAACDELWLARCLSTETGIMDSRVLAFADEIVASLAPGKREMVREIVINSVRRGLVDDSARRYLTAASGGPELAEILMTAIRTSRVKGSIGDGVPEANSIAPTDQP